MMVTVSLGVHERDRGGDLPLTHHRLHAPQEETEAQRVQQVTWAAPPYSAGSPLTGQPQSPCQAPRFPLCCLEDLASHPQRRYSRESRGLETHAYLGLSSSLPLHSPLLLLFQAVDTIFQAGPGMAGGSWVIIPDAASEV